MIGLIALAVFFAYMAQREQNAKFSACQSECAEIQNNDMKSSCRASCYSLTKSDTPVFIYTH
jgi:hypothetical protein